MRARGQRKQTNRTMSLDTTTGMFFPQRMQAGANYIDLKQGNLTLSPHSVSKLRKERSLRLESTGNRPRHRKSDFLSIKATNSTMRESGQVGFFRVQVAFAKEIAAGRTEEFPSRGGFIWASRDSITPEGAFAKCRDGMGGDVLRSREWGRTIGKPCQALQDWTLRRGDLRGAAADNQKDSCSRRGLMTS